MTMKYSACLVPLAVAVLALAGCSASDQYQMPSVDETAPSFSSIPMPDLGPWPPQNEPTAADVESQRIADQEIAWSILLADYPAAERPEVQFVSFDSPADLERCLNDADILTTAQPDGGIAYATDTQGAAVAAYECSSKYPARPTPGMSVEQLTWMYSYNLEYLIPCRVANGFNLLEESKVPPTLEEFVAMRGQWAPLFDNYLAPPDMDRLEAVCPYDPFVIIEP